MDCISVWIVLMKISTIVGGIKLPTLVQAIRTFFEIPASEMVREFKPLTEKDKSDFAEMFKEIGIEIVRPDGKS